MATWPLALILGGSDRDAKCPAFENDSILEIQTYLAAIDAHAT